MTKKQWILLAVLVLACGYVFFFTDWFATEGVQVTHAVRLPSSAIQPHPISRRLGHPVSPVSFTLDRKCRLTELEVVNAAEFATNKYAHPLWHLVARKSESAPVKGFVYGGYIRGMQAKVPNAEADPLEPNVAYRLILQIGDLKVEHDFKGPLGHIAHR